MKQLTILLVLFTISFSLISQTPQAFKYQSIVRNGEGVIMANQMVGFEISIHDSIPAGAIVYQETHSVETNDFGIATLEIGNGDSSPGEWSAIDWSANNKFLEVAVDITGGDQYVSLGTTQLLAVPYAMYSESTGDTSQWHKIEDDLYFNEGTVSIGTTNPLNWAKLDVRGNFIVDGYAVINRSDGSDAVLDIYNTVSDWEMVAASEANRFDIRKWSDVPALSILDNFNVGLRNTNPIVELDIRSDEPNVASRILLGNADNSSNVFLNSGTDTENPYISFKGSAALRFIFYDGEYQEMMRIQSDGKVGIGTSTPTQMLEVVDTIYSSSGGFKFPDGSVQTTAAIGGSASSINDLIDGKSDFISVFLGLNAGASNNGSQNTGVGHQSLGANSSGSQNSALGFFSLSANSTGFGNTAFGNSALRYNTTGGGNVGIGNFANHFNQTGNRNTIIGHQSGMGTAIHNKSDNVFLGYQAGYNETGNNKLYIENSNSATPLIGGDFALDEIYLNGRVGIGTTSPSTGLEVADTIYSSIGGFKFPDQTVQQTAITSLDNLSDGKTDGTSVFLGSGTGANDDGNHFNTAVGIEVLNLNESGRWNTASGYQSLNSNIGEGNTAHGYQAMYTNDDGSYNIASGYQTLFESSHGTNNIATGYRAMYHSNSSGYSSNGPWGLYADGSYNIANGTEALYNNRDGAYNIATGFQALYSNIGYGHERERGDYNTAIGYQALFNTDGASAVQTMAASYNIGVGYKVLYNNISGNGNASYGYQAGLSIVDGDYNTFLGYGADASSGSLDNATAIGANAVVNYSNKVRIGDENVTVIEGQVDFTYTSDKKKKENFVDIDSEQVLQKVKEFNIQSWNYKHDQENIRHYGPVAQDFFNAFGHDGFGIIGSDTTLCGSDVNGINMIAIQALEKRTSELMELKSELQGLKEENKRIVQQLAEVTKDIQLMKSLAEVNVSQE